MKNKSFVRGALVLTAGGIVSKLLGAVYRIPFANLVGNEGIGLYQMAYPIYTALLAISSGGIPVAVSIMVADCLSRGDRRGANRVLITALVGLGIMGFALSLALFNGAPYIAEHLLYDKRAAYSIMFISPALFFTGLLAPLRGYFQGEQFMLPTAVSQVIEQVVRVLTVFAGAYILMPYGLELTAAGATFGAVTGAIGALIVMTVFLWFARARGGGATSLSYGACARELTRLAVPVCLGALVMPIMQGIDALIVPLRLQTAGYDVSRATALYGELTGMAGPLINLPGVLTTALAASLVPAVSSAVSSGNRRLLQRRVEASLRLAILICLPAAVGLSVLAEPISLTLYNLPQMGTTLAALAPTALFLGLHQASAGALQGLGKTGLPVRNLILGGILKVIITYSLTARPEFGVRGAAIGSVAGFMLAAGLNLSELYKFLPRRPKFTKILLRPTLAGTIMAIILVVLREQAAQNRLSGIMLIGLGGLVYGLSLLLSGELKSEEVAQIPGIGPVTARLLLTIGIVRE